MSSEPEWICPICHDVEDDIAFVMPCCHQFCLGCIVRWAERTVSCAVCRQPIKKIRYSVRSEEDFLELAPPGTANPLAIGHRNDLEERPLVLAGGLPAMFWAYLYRFSVVYLDPVLTWVEEVLEEAQWWEVASIQANVILSLCYHGLDEEALIRDLQPILGDQATIFVRELIQVAINEGREALVQHMEIVENPDPVAMQGETSASSDDTQESQPYEELGQVDAEPSTSDEAESTDGATR